MSFRSSDIEFWSTELAGGYTGLASDQASIFKSANVISKFYSKNVNSSFQYTQDLDISWNTDLSIQLLDSLTIIEAIQDHDGTYMLVKLNGENT